MEMSPFPQVAIKLPVRVIDPDGKPVANAKVTPWALNSSQGHGPWRKDDKYAGFGPREVVTDEHGNAEVLYPKFRDTNEQIPTIGVSLFVDHPNFAYLSDLHVDTPLETKGPYEIKLKAGVPVEIHASLENKPADLKDLFAFWSDGRSYTGAVPEKLPNGALRISAMPPGRNSLLLVKLDVDRATHFSKIIDFELKVGEPKQLEIALTPSLRLQGTLSDKVPRPVRQGRIKLVTLNPIAADYERVQWLSWVPIQPDGTFVIDGWPAEEPIQLVALCEGYMATSGTAPDVVKDPRELKNNGFISPQVFDPNPDERIEVAMTSLVRCVATAIDEDEKPLMGITIASNPNVGWWNSGSQIYCHRLVRGEQLLRQRDFYASVDETFPMPFTGKTAADGKLALELPTGEQRLRASSDVFDLPVFLGRRTVRVQLVAGQTAEVTLRLQPRGTEKLGEWDKLAGVVFGCSTREGRRICTLPGVQKKLEEFMKRFQEGKNQRDPQLLFEAYAAVAEAFADVGDEAEAAKWRQKSAEQAEKAMRSK